MIEITALVLAGGRSQRFGSDKLVAPVDGSTVLQRTVDALTDVPDVVVVGPQVSLTRAVRWVREEPPGGGPISALERGLVEVSTSTVLVVAGDMPWLHSGIDVLLDQRDALDTRDSIVACDKTNRLQPLVALWRTESLVERVRVVAATDRRSATALYDGANALFVELPAQSLRDVDTADDLT